ncbi:MAG: L-rhamnose isomerase, partial [Oscillospiraceae bacterium]|nr:L-rhamnose isomerase [Oscillospiraceae bacterium]
GFKDIPASRLLPRKRFKESLDEILSIGYDKSKVYITLESKDFGIGAESFTTGSAEFCLSYSAKNNITPLMDNGHYHPTEIVSDKISSLLLFNEKLALHITRPVRWDSDHVVLLDDETKEICREIVRCNALDRVFAATDYFDAGINRISAWVVGVRNVQKAMLYALLQPNDKLEELQDSGNMTELMAYQEELKTLPFGDVWDYFCEKCGVPTGMKWLDEVKQYENEVLAERG